MPFADISSVDIFAASHVAAPRAMFSADSFIVDRLGASHVAAPHAMPSAPLEMTNLVHPKWLHDRTQDGRLPAISTNTLLLSAANVPAAANTAAASFISFRCGARVGGAKTLKLFHF